MSYVIISEHKDEDIVMPFAKIEIEVNMTNVFNFALEWTAEIEIITEWFTMNVVSVEELETIEAPDSNGICIEGGAQHILLTADDDVCLGNWIPCADSGIVFSTSIKIEEVVENMYIFTSGAEIEGSTGFAMFYRFAEYHVSFLFLFTKVT